MAGEETETIWLLQPNAWLEWGPWSTGVSWVWNPTRQAWAENTSWVPWRTAWRDCRQTTSTCTRQIKLILCFYFGGKPYKYTDQVILWTAWHLQKPSPVYLCLIFFRFTVQTQALPWRRRFGRWTIWFAAGRFDISGPATQPVGRCRSSWTPVGNWDATHSSHFRFPAQATTQKWICFSFDLWSFITRLLTTTCWF